MLRGSNFDANAHVLTGPLKGTSLNIYSSEGKYIASFWHSKHPKYANLSFSASSKQAAVHKAINWALQNIAKFK